MLHSVVSLSEGCMALVVSNRLANAHITTHAYGSNVAPDSHPILKAQPPIGNCS